MYSFKKHFFYLSECVCARVCATYVWVQGSLEAEL